MRVIAQLPGVRYPVIQGAMGVISNSLDGGCPIRGRGHRGFRAVLAPGAGGVQVGTRFIASHE